jgi:hypothetical protein
MARNRSEWTRESAPSVHRTRGINFRALRRSLHDSIVGPLHTPEYSRDQGPGRVRETGRAESRFSV